MTHPGSYHDHPGDELPVQMHLRHHAVLRCFVPCYAGLCHAVLWHAVLSQPEQPVLLLPVLALLYPQGAGHAHVGQEGRRRPGLYRVGQKLCPAWQLRPTDTLPMPTWNTNMTDLIYSILAQFHLKLTQTFVSKPGVDPMHTHCTKLCLQTPIMVLDQIEHDAQSFGTNKAVQQLR